MMLGLAFLNPMLLWALPLAAVPIIIHILNRRRFQKVPWAAMTFLLKAMKRNRKRMRMEQWLVLLLRVLAVLLLISLVSRPQLGGSSLLGSRTHHVVILDDSASMTQRTGSTVLFEKAQDRIKMLADDLGLRRQGDIFSLVTTSAAGVPHIWSQRIGGSFSRDAGSRLKELQVSDRSPDLGKALEVTVTRAHEVEDASRTEYYLVGDRRSWDWATPDDKPRPALLAGLSSMARDNEHVTVLTVGGQHRNLAVIDVKLVDRLAIAAVPVTLGIDVKNFGLDPTAPTTVSIEIDGQSRITQDVPQLAPGERYTVQMDHTFHEAGPHRLDALLEPSESFPFDDRRTLALQVRDKSRVLLVDGDPDEDLGEVFFLRATLDVPESGIEAQVVTENGFDEANLDAFDMIWLCNVQSPTPEAAERLEAFVASGGGLAITCGSLIDAPRYNELFWKDGAGLLPLPIGEINGDPDRPEHAHLANKDHAMCTGVAEFFELVLGNYIQVKRWLELEEPADHQASIVVRIRGADGPPMLATRTYKGSAGEVALFSISADLFWSDLPRTDLFLVMTHQLHHFAARRDDQSRSNLLTDGVLTLAVDPGLYRADVTMRSLAGDDERTITAAAPKPEVVPEDKQPGTTKPGQKPAVKPGDQPAANPAAQAPAASNPMLSLKVAMSELTERGAYEIELERHDGVPDKRMIARNAPPNEGRLVAFDEPAFKKMYPSNVHDLVTFVRDETGVGTAASEGEAWPLLAALLLVGLLAESLLAWRFGRR
ncbi:MAG: hypothetical protein ACI9SE_002843 [Neolewinella sp.]|jgi:hypothetical protein